MLRIDFSIGWYLVPQSLLVIAGFYVLKAAPAKQDLAAIIKNCDGKGNAALRTNAAFFAKNARSIAL
ncbi:hypothetical protein JOE11_000314 [Robbsia andropogonis]|uniref:hypothetical protein n=1 Tax=Robbsia andropogonis TaxID=28092 RepID=UPI003D24258B